MPGAIAPPISSPSNDLSTPGGSANDATVAEQEEKAESGADDENEPYSDCVRKHRPAIASQLAALGTSAWPKKWLPPGRVVKQSQRLTTPASSLGHVLHKNLGAPRGLKNGLRVGGRVASVVGTPLLLWDGLKSWKALIDCAF